MHGEVFDRGQLLLLSDLVEHTSTDGRGVCAEDVLLCLLQLPIILVPIREVGDMRIWKFG